MDFAGYQELSAMPRAFSGWQSVLVELSTGSAQPNVAGFREMMPLLFFDLDAFAVRYDALRLDTAAG